MTDEIKTDTPIYPQGGILSTITTASNPAMAVLAYWREILLALILGFMIYQHYRIVYLKSEVAKSEITIATYKNNALVAEAKVTEMGNKIIELSAISTILNKELTDLKPTLDKIKKNSDTTVAKILNGVTPKNCKEVSDYILNNQKNYTWDTVK